jgi:hypothetical protein
MLRCDRIKWAGTVVHVEKQHVQEWASLLYDVLQMTIEGGKSSLNGLVIGIYSKPDAKKLRTISIVPVTPKIIELAHQRPSNDLPQIGLFLYLTVTVKRMDDEGNKIIGNL